MTGSFIAILDTTVVDVVIPKMMGPLSTDMYGIQCVITAYMTSAAVTLLLTHNLSHVVGLKKLFIINHAHRTWYDEAPSKGAKYIVFIIDYISTSRT